MVDTNEGENIGDHDVLNGGEHAQENSLEEGNFYYGFIANHRNPNA